MNRRVGNMQNQNSARRPIGKTNFVPGGQVFQKQPAPTPSTPVQPISAPVQQPAPVTPSKPTPQFKQEIQTPEQPKIVKGENQGDAKMDTEKKSWMNRKIPKKEKLRRRNIRLSKLLQPKNALKILHELVKNPEFNILETDGQFQATVIVAGKQHIGVGKSKNAAKNTASELAIKYLMKHKNVSAIDEPLSQDGNEKMDTSENYEDTTLPWQQVASLALYKLFDSWGENPNTHEEQLKPKKVNSARKMPENPTSLNPIMMVHQMYPQASFEEVSQVGTAPNVVFTIQCNIDGQTFLGTGPSKKSAKKQASYAVCHKLLGIVYPPEDYTPPSQ